MSAPEPLEMTHQELFYPNRLYVRPRKRQYAELTFHREAEMVTIEDERGVTAVFDADWPGYQAAVAHVTSQRLSVVTRFSEGASIFPWLSAALDDERANILSSRSMGVVGVGVRRGRGHGSFINGNSWHRDLLHEDGTQAFLGTLRRVAEALGVGSYDTPAAAGTATLYRQWQQLGLPLIRRAPGALEDLLTCYRIGGRVESAGVGRAYPTLYEADIKSAYPSVVAGGLPWGAPRYEYVEPTPARGEFQPVYGLWRFHLDAPLACAPVPTKRWALPDMPVSWNLAEGDYLYGGWQEEIEALRALGIRVSFDYGWSWARVGSELAPWINEMNGYRDSFTQAGDEDAATIVKIMTNATIGRWGSTGAMLTMLPIEHSYPGDKIVALPHWAFADGLEEPPLLAVHQEEGYGRCAPQHWSSWIHMQVRMEVYRIARLAEQQGYQIASVNYDGILSSQPLEIGVSRFGWKFITHQRAYIPYPRALQSEVAGKTRSVLPGIPKGKRTGEEGRPLAHATSPP